VDAKAVIRDALTVDMTVNPDFSQVESDEPQVTVNQRFEVFFPEKRPFFIENAGYFDYFGSFTSRSPEFRSELGYIRRVDLREVLQEADFSWYPERSRILRIGSDIEVRALWDYGGELQDWQVEPGVEVELPGQTELDLIYVAAFERYEGIEFHRGGPMFRASTEWFSWLGGSVHYFRGSGIDYYPADGLPPFLGTEQSLESGVTLRPYSRLRLDLSYLYSDLSTSSESALPPGAPRGRVFANHLMRSRVNYQFTRELSARVILDYESLSPNPALVDLDHERRFNTDVLFTYLVNPWTAIYVGYSDGYENRPVTPVASPPPSRADLPMTSTGRQVFVKLSYLFRL
jgi:hypothetical protein